MAELAIAHLQRAPQIAQPVRRPNNPSAPAVPTSRVVPLALGVTGISAIAGSILLRASGRISAPLMLAGIGAGVITLFAGAAIGRSGDVSAPAKLGSKPGMGTGKNPAEERVEGPTPAGGDYSIARYFDDDGNAVAKDDATQMVITEYAADGRQVGETFGRIGN